MIKKIALMMALSGLAISSYGQGSVQFSNFNTNTAVPNITAKVFFADGTTAVAGTGFYAQLYAADGSNQAESSLTAKGFAVNFRSSAAAGIVQTSGTATGAQGSHAVTPAVQVTSVANGVVTLQMRVWSSTFATYELAAAAYAQDATSAFIGKSTLFNLTSVAPPGTPADLQGLTSFNLLPVPEPSTIALGVLGAGSLLFLRRKK